MYVIHDKERVTAALRDSKGNITRAAMLLGVSKPYFVAVVKKLELTSWASDLRTLHGAPPTGRPPNALLDYLDTVAYRPRKRRKGKKPVNNVTPLT